MDPTVITDLGRDVAGSLAAGRSPWIAGLAYVVAVLVSYACLQFAACIAKGRTAAERWRWLLGGGFALGVGVWSIHFVAVIGDLRLKSIALDPALAIASVVASVAAAGAVLQLVARREVATRQLILGGGIAGLGTGAMHYCLMAAMNLRGLADYQTSLFVAAIAAASLLAVIALRVRAWIGRTAGRYPTLYGNVAAALILGIALSVLLNGALMSTHYAAQLIPIGEGHGFGAERFTLAIAVCLTLLTAITTMVLERDRREAASFRFLFRKNPNVMWVHDLRTYQILEANEGACLAYGYSAEEFTRLTVFDLICPEDHERLRAQMADVGAEIGMCDRGLWRHRTKDGAIRDVAITSGSMSFRHRAARLVLAKDVTQQRQTEARLAQAEASLRQRQKLEAIGQLTGGIAHDFNNVLAIMMMKLERLADELPLDSPGQPTIASALAAGERAADVVARLMTFARRRPLEPKETVLTALFDELAGLLPSAVSRGTSLSLDIASDLPLCRIDRDGFEMAMLNLAVNARDAMPEGGLLRVSARSRTITAADVAARPDLQAGQWVEVAVADTGIGMSADVQSRIFEPFFTTKGDGKGTGLGLPMVYGFVHQSGGFITVDSAVGRGATFSVFLPALATVTPLPGPADRRATESLARAA
jgi:PAS domain S-box-containing protein